MKLPKGEPLDFGTHPFLADPYRDTHQELVFLKGAQLGFSTLSIIRTLWAVTKFPISAIYTFPTTEDVTRFTASRINPIIAGSEYLKSRILNADSVRMKQFAHHPVQRGEPTGPVSTIYFNGAQNDKDATTADADLLIHDEEDRSNAQVIEQYESRLDHSRFKWKIRISTPTTPGAGIDRAFRNSDQRAWMHRCPRCNHEFTMSFPDCIVPDTIAEVEAGAEAYYVCPSCRDRLPEEARITGRWVPLYPGRDRSHGYAVSQMAAPWISAERILDRRQKASYEADFWNLVMGQPWIDATDALTREAILSRQDPMRAMQRYGQGGFMGVDVGSSLDVVIDELEAGQSRTVYMGRHKEFAELDQLMNDFHVRACVIDAYPEERLAKEFQQRWGRTVWRAAYINNPTAPREWDWNEDTQVVKLPRTEFLSQSATELLTVHVLPRFDGSPAWEAFIRHHENSQKVPVFNDSETAQQSRMIDRYEWIDRGPDHFFHARSYAMAARNSPTMSMARPSRGLVGLRRGAAALPPSIDLLRPGAPKRIRMG